MTSFNPAILIVPGLNNSGPDHWQSHWERDLSNASRVELGAWSSPRRTSWTTNLGIAIASISGPKIIVAHSLGCLAVAWWASQEPDSENQDIVGALLVAPPSVDNCPLDSRLANFAPAPRVFLPFPTILVGSENDPYCSLRHANKLARRWGARFVNAGPFGHINAASGIDDWPYGLYLLRGLLSQESYRREEASKTALVKRLRQKQAYQKPHIEGKHPT
jgi:predicted alpha/beta hydrolase family esterase